MHDDSNVGRIDIKRPIVGHDFIRSSLASHFFFKSYCPLSLSLSLFVSSNFSMTVETDRSELQSTMVLLPCTIMTVITVLVTVSVHDLSCFTRILQSAAVTARISIPNPEFALAVKLLHSLPSRCYFHCTESDGELQCNVGYLLHCCPAVLLHCKVTTQYQCTGTLLKAGHIN